MVTPSEANPTTISDRQRVRARGEIGIGPRGLEHLYQSADARIRLPRPLGPAFEAVLMNTAGGLTGGDQLDWQASVHGTANLSLTTAAAEKLYRTHGPTARVSTRLDIDEGARLAWLPQETIVFEGSALERRLDVNLHPSATFLAVEAIVLGRRHMGEQLKNAWLNDQWRVHRDGALLHAEALQLDGRSSRNALERSTAHGIGAFATVLYCSNSPREWLQSRVDRCLQTGAMSSGRFAGSVLEGRLILRLFASDAQCLRQMLILCVGQLDPTFQLPRVWHS